MAGGGDAPASPGYGSPPVVMPPTVPAPAVYKSKALILGDENLLFGSGLQEAYPDIEFTVASTLSRQNLEAYNFDPSPAQLQGRIRHMVDPCRLGKHFQPQMFEHLVLFLPGLSFMVPRELGTADRPLFAYRTHLYVFHLIRQVKPVLKGDSARIHLVWPEETGLMTSPCGAAGLEMPQLLQFCGCMPVEACLDYGKLEEGWFMPFIFGEVPQLTPEWLQSIQIWSFSIDKSPIPVPLSVALLLHPDAPFVCLKDPTRLQDKAPPGPGAPLRACLIHEAMARRERLKEIFGPKENPEDAKDAYGLVPEPVDEDALLSIPMEIFMLSFDEVPHITMLLKYQVCDEQPGVSVATIDVLDPRLPTRISRPPPPKGMSPVGVVMPPMKRLRQTEEEWGGMHFYCPLTRICTMTADRMRLHMSGDLYKRLAASTPGWDTSPEKKLMIEVLEEAEQLEEQQKRMRKAISPPSVSGKSKGRGKGK